MEFRKLLIISGTIVFVLFVSQWSVLRYTKILSPPNEDKESSFMVVQNVCHSNNSGVCRLRPVEIDTSTNILDGITNFDYGTNKEVALDESGETFYMSLMSANDNQTDDSVIRKAEFSYGNSREDETIDSKTELVKKDSIVSKDEISGFNISTLSRTSISIFQMYSKLSMVHNSSCMKRPQCRKTSQCDRELLKARLEIENSSIIRSTPELNASVFRNISMFISSYELMEKMLKVYIYEEGEKPIFHEPLLTGIYASEGWFMKLLEENKKFIVKDPEKAHLFYLPFSSQYLRWALFGKDFHNKRDLQKLLKKYVDLIGKKYRFWNKNGGSDHFLVACHDWASKLTRRVMKNCIRALCNANAATDFEIGKDTSLPVTFIRSLEDPIKDIGGKTPSERTTLAFFAGSMHGYLRPILLHYWENKELDMKIVGPMANGSEGEQAYDAYMEQMKSSKYCICAKGYQVHTPRVIEAILFECIPVIISDNYVPPFFEILNWESFCVFVQEREIPNLRNILISIPEEKYLAMHSRLKMVRQHFLWHQNPVKYDAFHMILHSIWYTRVFQMKAN